MIEEKIPYHKPFILNDNEIDFINYNTKQIIKSGILSKNGYWSQELERRIKELYGVKYVISTGNCTSGIQICLGYMNKDSHIQVPMFEWRSILYILQYMKKSIFWNDIDLKTWLPIESYIFHSLYINTFGNIGKSMRKDAIYDSSHCLGAKIEDVGLAHVFSLSPTKLITSCEGGIIITNDDIFYKFAKEQRDKLSRMSEVHALIGCVYLSHLDEILEWKKKVYEYYKNHILGMFQEIPNNSTYNTIGFLNTHELKIPKHIETRQYYEPIQTSRIICNSNTKIIYEKIICLPSYFGCPYEEITEEISTLNSL